MRCRGNGGDRRRRIWGRGGPLGSILTMRVQQNVLCWNCRGARSGELLREIKEFIRVHRPVITILMEPRISGEVADSVCKKLGYKRWVRSDSEGFNGGVWCLWNDEEVGVVLRYGHTDFLHLAVTSICGKRWELSAIYAPPHARKRAGLWEILDEMRIEGPWALIGKFNCVLQNEERSSGRGASFSFQSWTEGKGLLDLGYQGPAFTWWHGVNLSTRKAARLDRALCDDVWRCLFPAAELNI